MILEYQLIVSFEKDLKNLGDVQTTEKMKNGHVLRKTLSEP